MDIQKRDYYLNKIIQFKYENGCIPANAVCFCYQSVGNYYWVHFKEPVLGMQNIKLHKEVLDKHGTVMPDNQKR